MDDTASPPIHKVDADFLKETAGGDTNVFYTLRHANADSELRSPAVEFSIKP